MTPSRAQWKTLFELLDTALELQEPQLGVWLQQVNQSHPELRVPLQQLLAERSRIETRDFLGSPFQIAAAPLAAPMPDTLVGPYRLLSQLGRGGMGDVWLAERIDGQLQRRVAIKLPNIDPRRGDLTQRFSGEREILATLEHPNIGRLYDAGEAADGRPYLVLEYVDGIAITDYCSRKQLRTAERIALFLQVLGAVQFAHSRLVVHRDLKPANILVSADGQVHLLDFGIAKLLSTDTRAVAESALTQMSGRALTPQYASPEQIRGETMTTASDIYSLGVLLYELLAGRLPYELKRGSAAELEEAILTVEPQSLPAALGSDLAAIVARSIHKQPAQRYSTADAFAQDLQAFLANRPIVARPESGLRRMAKSVRRNRLAFGATAAVFAALSLGLAIALAQARRAQAQTRVAQAEASKAAFVKDFLLDIFNANSRDQPDPQQAQNTTALQLLDRAATRLASQPAVAPDVNDDLLRTVGTIYADMGVIDTSVALRKQRLQLAQRAFAPDDPRLVEAQLEYAGALYDASGWKEAIGVLSALEAALDARRDFNSEYRARLDRLLAAYWRGTDLPKARTYAYRSIELYAKSYPDSDNYAGALFDAGLVEGDLLNIAASERLYRSAVATQERLGAPDAQRIQKIVTLAEAQRGILMGAEADANFRKGLALSLKLNGRDHIDTLQTQMRYGLFLRLVGRNRESLQNLRDAEQHARTALGEAETFHLPSIRAELANTLQAIGEPEKALQMAERALAVRERTRAGTSQHAAMLAGSAPILGTLGRFSEADAALQRAAAIRSKIGSPVYASRIPPLQAQNLLAQGRATDALAIVELAQAQTRQAAAKDPQRWSDDVLAASLQLQRARALMALGRYADAEPLLRMTLQVAQTAHDPTFYAALANDASQSMAQLYLETGRAAQALQTASSVLAWRQANQVASSPGLLEAQSLMARALRQLGRFDEAAVHGKIAMRIAGEHKELGPQYLRLLR